MKDDSRHKEENYASNRFSLHLKKMLVVQKLSEASGADAERG